MNDDLVQRLHDLPPEDLTVPPDRLERVHARVRRRRQRRIVGTLAVAGLAVVGAVLGVTLPGGGGEQGLHEIEPGPTATPTPSGVTPTPGEHQSPPPGFIPASISFVAPSTGYAWGPPSWPGSDPLPGVLAVTRDGGRSWTAVPTQDPPPYNTSGGPTRVLFTDADHGYLAGGALYRTSDGGRRWQHLAAPGPITALRATSDRLYAVVCADAQCDTGGRLFGGPLDGSSLQPVTQIAPWPFHPTSVLVAAGSRVYLLTPGPTKPGGDLGPATLWFSDDGRHWTQHRAPCTWPGADAAALAAYSPTGLALVCGGQPSAGSQPKTAYASSDGGAHWTRQNQPSSFSDIGYVGDLAATDANTWVLGALRGGLLVTHDAGHTWSATQPNGLTPDIGVEGWGQVLFTDPTHAIAVPSTLNGQVLAFSADAGTTWTVEHASPSGDPATYAQARTEVDAFLAEWARSGLDVAGKTYLVADQRLPTPPSPGVLDLVTGHVTGFQPYSWQSADQFTVIVTMNLNFGSSNPMSFGNGANTRLITFTRQAPTDNYLMSLATGP